MKLLLRALYKLPLIHAKVYRGVKLDLAETYNALAGKWFSWWSFSSTTLDLKVLETPLFLGKEGDRTLFCIEALGVDIAAFSAMPNESEVLMLPGMRLTVMPGINKEEGLWQFNVSVSKEVAPVIDFYHPGCHDFNMTLTKSSSMDSDLEGGERREGGMRRAEDVKQVEKPGDVGSRWPTIPGCGPY